MSDWIKCKDKLPESESFVLVTIEDGSEVPEGECVGRQVYEALFTDDKNVDELWYPHFIPVDENVNHEINWTKEVIAWMPLPKPFEEG